METEAPKFDLNVEVQDIFRTFEAKLYLYSSLSRVTTDELKSKVDWLSKEFNTKYDPVLELVFWMRKAELCLKTKNYSIGLGDIKNALYLLETKQQVQNILESNGRNSKRSEAIALNLQAKLAAGSGDLWSSLEFYNKAIIVMEALSNHNAEKAVLYSSKGALKNDMGYHDEAITEHEKAYDLDKKNSILVASYARGIHQMTFLKARQTLERNKYLPSSLAGSAKGIRSLLQQEPYRSELAKAKEKFTEALKLSPNDETGARYYANLLSDMGDYQAALHILEDEKYVNAGPMFFFSRALVYWQIHDPAKMQVDLERTVQMLQELTDNKRYQEWLVSLQAVVIPFLQEQSYKEEVVQLMPYDDVIFSEYNKKVYQDWKERSQVPAILERSKLDFTALKIVTHDIYAALASQAYQQKDHILPNDWEVYLKADDVDLEEEGYFAVAFINRKTENVVIAHRGTKPTMIANLKTDYNGVVLARTDLAVFTAFRFNHQVKERMKREKFDHYRLSYTGHSLGALHAEVSSYHDNLLLKKSGRDLSKTQLSEAVTFESPGSYYLLLGTITSHKHRPTELDDNLIRVITYLAEPNLVNTARRHVGELRHIHPMHRPGIAKRMFSAISGRVGQTLIGHDMDDIVACFRESQKIDGVADWPEGICTNYLEFAKYFEGKSGDLTKIEEGYFKQYIQHLEFADPHLYELDLSCYSAEVRNLLSSQCKPETSGIFQRCVIQGDILHCGNSGLTKDELAQHIAKHYLQWNPQMQLYNDVCPQTQPITLFFSKEKLSLSGAVESEDKTNSPGLGNQP